MTRPRSSSSTVGRRTLIAGAGLALAAPAVRAQGTSGGVALVIGNSKYHWEAPLPNVKRDAPDIAKRFQAMGLKTELVQDAGREAMRQAVDKFDAAARGTNFAAFYFAGHGANWAQATYLVPADADLASPSVKETLLPVASIGAALDGAAHRLAIFDNCRNNPADGWRQLEAQRSAAAGSGPVTRRPNALILYSTAPGRVALDGPAGQNSPFTAALLRQFEAPSIDLQTLAPKLRRDLLIATEGRQLLWAFNTYQQPYTIKGARGQGGASPTGWAADPSKIVELPSAYAYAQEIRVPLPEGLIAHRAPSGSRIARMVGSYKYHGLTSVGPHPAILIVMSVDDGQTAELIMATNSEVGPFWRFLPGTISGDQIEFQPRATASRFLVRWTDINSGKLTQINDRNMNAAGRPLSRDTTFTRLDG